MPRELVAVGPRQPVIREYDEPSLGRNEVRVVTEFSAPKHGTESGSYRGVSPFSGRRYDPELQVFVPACASHADRPHQGEHQGFPVRLGNMSVGTVTGVGPEVEKFKVGDRVFGHMPIRETHTVPEGRLHPMPEEMTPEQVVYWDPAEFALGAVRDANVRLGEVVALFGLGAIGFMVLQMAKLSGAVQAIAVDPLANRRELALQHGADDALDPTAVDAGLEIKRMTGKGVDVAIEASGSYRALHQAIRATHLGGLVVPLGFYQGEAEGLRLGEEWHINRITMRSSRSISDPNRDHPMWDSARIKQVAFELLRAKRVSVEGLVTPIVPFEDSAEAYRMIDEHPEPERCVKLGVRFSR